MSASDAAPPGPAARPKPRRLPPALLRRPQAARHMGVGTSTLDRLNAAGLVPPPIRLGGSLCWGRHELDEWCRHGCPPRAEWRPVWDAILAARRTRRSA